MTTKEDYPSGDDIASFMRVKFARINEGLMDRLIAGIPQVEYYLEPDMTPDGKLYGISLIPANQHPNRGSIE